MTYQRVVDDWPSYSRCPAISAWYLHCMEIFICHRSRFVYGRAITVWPAENSMSTFFNICSQNPTVRKSTNNRCNKIWNLVGIIPYVYKCIPRASGETQDMYWPTALRYCYPTAISWSLDGLRTFYREYYTSEIESLPYVIYMACWVWFKGARELSKRYTKAGFNRDLGQGLTQDFFQGGGGFISTFLLRNTYIRIWAQLHIPGVRTKLFQMWHCYSLNCQYFSWNSGWGQLPPPARSAMILALLLYC